MFAALTTNVLRHRWLSACVLVLVVASVASGIAKLGGDFSMTSFFGHDDPETTYLEGYLERWGEDDVLILAFDAGEPYGLLTRERMEAMETLAEELAAVEGVGGVSTLTQVPRVNRVGFQFIPVPLIATVPRPDDPEAKRDKWRETTLADARLVPNFLSADGRYGSMLVSLDVETTDLAQVRPVVHKVEQLVESWQSQGVTTYIAGVPAIRADILDVIVRDQIVLAPAAAFAMGLLMLLLFRSRHGVIIPSVAAGVPVIMLLGLMGWTGESFGLLNQVFLALVPAIAVADAIHLISRYHEETRALSDDDVMDEASRDQAIINAMSYMGVACFLTSFTTIVGFLSLLATDMNALRMFGVYAAAGVAFAYFTVLLIVPLALLGTRSGARKLAHGDEGLLGGLLRASAHITIRYPGVTLASAVVVSALFAYLGTMVNVDTKVTESFDENHPTTIGNTVVDEHLGGVLALEYELLGTPGSFKDPEVLAATDRAETFVKAKNEVRAVFGPATLLRSTSALIGGPDAVPTSPGVIERLYQVNENSPVMRFAINEDASSARLIVRVIDEGARDYLELGKQVSERFTVEFAGLGVEPHLTGSSFVAYRGLSRVTADLRNSLSMAFVIIGLIIAVLFRDLRLGVLSLIPNALPLLVGYGLMGVLGWPLEPAPAVVFTIAVGISVDSAIHVIARYREERSLGLTVDDAIRQSVFHSGRAVVITAIILVVGFAVNTWSSSPANASFGRVGTVVIAAAIVSNLLVLPALLKLLDRKAAAAEAAATQV